jgi:hypothetical protein
MAIIAGLYWLQDDGCLGQEDIIHWDPH